MGKRLFKVILWIVVILLGMLMFKLMWGDRVIPEQNLMAAQKYVVFPIHVETPISGKPDIYLYEVNGARTECVLVYSVQNGDRVETPAVAISCVRK